MSVARITIVTFKTEAAADQAAASYIANAPGEFPEAEQLIGLQSDGNRLAAVSLYDSQEAMDRADAARDKRMSNPEIISMETIVGDVRLNHAN
ncbi:MAG: hypothetical protein QGG88_01520 [Gammaproteobacteria bacterium]|jgi:hypothetical protein|nr:hypothetical protein [Gammaproteobacteria bacterium]